VFIGQDVELHPTAKIEGPILVGDNTRIGPGTTLGPYAVIGSNVLIGSDAKVVHGVVLDRAHVAALAQVRGSVLGRAATLDRGSSLEEGAVTGDEVSVGAGAIIKPQVKIYPSKTVDAGAIVTQSIVHEKHGSRSLFGSRGVSGLVNVAVTPQVAVRLAMAYGTTLGRGSTVVTGRDASRAARAMKRAIIAGLNCTGVTVHDLELVPLPLTRFTVRSEQASGGISVRTSPDDPECVEIRLFDSAGSDLPEGVQRKIERVFFREDYRRPGPTKLGELEFPPRALEQYSAGILRAVDIQGIRQRRPKVVIDYSFGPASLIGPSLMGRLGCDALAVNAFTDEHRPVLVSDDLERLLLGLAEHVRRSGSDLGVLLEPGGEIAHLIDGTGRVVGHDQALLMFLRYEASRGATGVAVPVSGSSACETLAGSFGTSVHRTPTGLPALMARSAHEDVDFAGNAEGGLIFSRFMPAPDALMTFAKALEMVSVSGNTLADTVDDLPETHVATRSISTPWHQKGAVMRSVASSVTPDRLILVDGVKVFEPDGWALVIPLPDEPNCRVWAESGSRKAAEALADRYAALVYEVIQEAAVSK
jgi:mannose-1-phosphate guanylyltransferase/phosphomannomutase